MFARWRHSATSKINTLNNLSETVMFRIFLFDFSGANLKSTFRLPLVKYCRGLKIAMENKPVEQSIKNKLQSGLNPVYLNIINESHMHNVPKGSETHFKVVIVSEKFENMALLGRHRLVNSLLDFELKNGVHALSIVTKTPSQWNPKEEIKSSPNCLGGFGK